MRTIVLALLLFPTIVFALDPDSDLGSIGNQEVAERFQQYVDTHPIGCTPQTEGVKRVLVSGFGLFTGMSYNFSGVIVESMSSSSFWPSSFNLKSAAPFPLPAPASGTLHETDFGARANVRNLEFDGESYEACFVLLDVSWDLAASILVHEMMRFEPDFVLMTGVAGLLASLEHGAFNLAFPLHGYNSDGSPNRYNRPVALPVLPPETPGVKLKIDFSWKPFNLWKVLFPYVYRRGAWLVSQLDANLFNSYICNNVSYVVAHAALNVPINLAGDKIRLRPQLSNAPVVGFFHIPSGSKVEALNVFEWARILAFAIHQSI